VKFLWNYVSVCSTVLKVLVSPGRARHQQNSPTKKQQRRTQLTVDPLSRFQYQVFVMLIPPHNTIENFSRSRFYLRSHNLTVTLTQGGNMSPLTLDYLMIDGGSTPYLGTGSSASSGGLNSASTSSVFHFSESLQERQPQLQVVSTRQAPPKVPLLLVLLSAAFLAQSLSSFCCSSVPSATEDGDDEVLRLCFKPTKSNRL